MFENNVKFVDMHDGNLVEELLVVTDATEGIACFCIHPNNKEIVVATEKFSLRHFDVESKACLRVIKAHSMPIIAMAYDTTGTLVATGSADRTVKVWDIVKGFCTHNFKFHTDIVQTVYFHPDPSKMQLFSTGSDNTIRVYDLTATKLVATLSDHVSLPTQVTVSNNGRLLVSSGRDKVRLKCFLPVLFLIISFFIRF
jgi:U3 small nucleolar RNA-associated protein 13